MGFHKILKKHDRRLPNPCRAFYLARLHDQSWVRGDYSDVLVSMSRVYSKLRGDEEKEQKESSKQVSFRSAFFCFYSSSLLRRSNLSCSSLLSIIGFCTIYKKVLGSYRRYFISEIHDTSTSSSFLTKDYGW
jgi:hypothetical protein